MDKGFQALIKIIIDYQISFVTKKDSVLENSPTILIKALPLSYWSTNKKLTT